jgi:hypothetical protein
MNEDQLGILFVFLATSICITILLILREFWCWYWKINERIALQREIVSLLKSSGNHSEKNG